MSSNDYLVTSTDPEHPANHICTLCRNFYALGWVTGTGGGTSIKQGSNIFIAPSGVQKELIKPMDIFVMDHQSQRDAIQSGEDPNASCFEIEKIEQIKGLPRGKDKEGMLGFFDRLQVPIIENTAFEEDLTQSLEATMEKYPDAYAVLVRRHGVYVWGDDVQKAKTQAESLDYIFRLAVEMRRLGLAWLS
ncbi:MAG: hypothetical protein LQ342_002620 [Letrouitia transgressa]|nr:MAG: hypothetical protein LQ342_002620 [Letrouitia transgressa]